MSRNEQLSKKIYIVIVTVLMLLISFRYQVSARTVIQAGNQDQFANAIASLDSCNSNGTDKFAVGGKDTSRSSQMLALMVKLKGKEPDWSMWNIDTLVRGPEGHFVLQFVNSRDLQLAADALKGLGNVEYVQRNSQVKISSYSGWSWGIKTLGIDTFTPHVAEVASGKTITVAVVDSGIYKHSAFSSRVLSGKNIIRKTTNTSDDCGHGTHVTGTIYDLTRGINVKFLPVKVLDSRGIGNSFNMASGIRYAADHGAKIINLSANLDYGEHDYYLHESIDYAVSKGIVVVVSAGNSSRPASNCCPADLTSAIVVGAADSKDKLAHFSNYGKPLDMLAPGVSINSTSNHGGYEIMSGTSMAAPHITAMAALLKMMDSTSTPAQIEYILKKNCRDLYTSGWDKYSGWGMPNLASLLDCPVEGISLSEASVSMQACSGLKLKATIQPADASNSTLIWASSNSSVACVSSSGYVVAKSQGTATITVKSPNGKKASCKISVSQAPKLSQDAVKLKTYDVNTKKCTLKGTLSSAKSATGLQCQLQNSDFKTISTKTVTAAGAISFSGLSNQKTYYYRSRAFYDINGVRTYGLWSNRRAFSTAYVSVKKLSGYAGVNLAIPKVKGVKSFKVLMSITNKTGSYTTIATVLPGKTLKITRLKGKKLSAYGLKQSFYVVIKPTYESGVLADSVFIRKKFTLK